jgi:hypothetical protein
MPPTIATTTAPLRTACSPRRRIRVGWVRAIVVVLLAACDAKAPDRRQQVDQLTEQIRSMPGVVAARNTLVNSRAQGLVFFRVDVEVADEVTGDQLAAVTSRYLDNLRDVNYAGYQTGFDASRGWNVFSVDAGDGAVNNRDQIIQQARDWPAIRREFAGATIRFGATITHPGGAPVPGGDGRHPSAGTIELPDAADYTAVAAAVTTLATKFPDLSGGDWTVAAGKQYGAGDIRTSRRLPHADEIDVWNKLNSDQSAPHVVAMTINGAVTGPVWVSEKTRSRDIDVAVQLAQQHLPIVAALPAPVLYTANDRLRGHLSDRGKATGSLAITVGGCTQRTYQPTAAEQALIGTYEKCGR